MSKNDGSETVVSFLPGKVRRHIERIEVFYVLWVALVFGLFLLPFITLFPYLKDLRPLNFLELNRVVLQTLLQASLSTLFSVAFGICAGLGLLSIKSARARRITELFVLLPNFFPTLFVIVASLNFLNLIASFPFGLIGVVLVHTFMNVGLVGVFMAQIIERRAGGYVELATIEGASRYAISRRVLESLKSEILSISFVVFLYSWTSFAVPLVVGLDSGETLEVLIYRSLLGRGDLSSAIQISLIQMVLIIFASTLLWPKSGYETYEPRSVFKLGSRASLWGILLFTASLLAVNVFDSIKGGIFFQQNRELLEIWWSRFGGSVFECTFVAILVLLFFTAFLFWHRSILIERFLLSYSAPSAAVVALAFYLLWDTSVHDNFTSAFILALAFSITIIPVLYRLKIRDAHKELMRQIESARILGAPKILIFTKVTLPQLKPVLFRVAGWGAFWASGDFALASLISGRDLTLAMSAQTFLGGYRYELATFFTVSSLIVGAIILLFFEGLIYVSDKKLNT